MHNINPTAGEQYYLRMLLLHVKGCKSYADVRTVELDSGEEIVYDTFREACVKRGLLADDKEWFHCMQDAMDVQTNYTMILQLFVILVLFSEVQNPLKLWKHFEEPLMENVQYRYPSLQTEPDAAHDQLLHEMQLQFTTHDRSPAEFNLPTPSPNYANRPPPQHRSAHHQNHTPDEHPPPEDSALGQIFSNLSKELQTSILHYDAHLLHDTNTQMLKSMAATNPTQIAVYNKIFHHIVHYLSDTSERQPCAYFIDAPAGTGKTYLLQALIAAFRSLHYLVLPMATSGIAATNFVDGRTAHGRLKIPIPISETSMLDVPIQSQLAAALKCSTCILIWDETANCDNLNISAVDRTLRSLTGQDCFMGGIPFIAASDPRQILPVIPHGSRGTIVHHTLYNSDTIWPHFIKARLILNMRVLTQGEPDDQEFADWLLTVGEGTHPPPEEGITPAVPANSIQLPAEICIDNTQHTDDPLNEDLANASIKKLLDFVYEAMNTVFDLGDFFAQREIVAPTLQAVAEINELMTDRMQTEELICLSADTTEERPHKSPLPQEYLNALNYITGLPPHKLRLRVGMPVILLKNLAPPNHCNGTRYIVLHMHSTKITLRAITGVGKGEILYLPRIINKPGEGVTGWSFVLKRLQFPIVPAFAITINKSLGQTVKVQGVYLPTSVFSHGQLYVALSRTGAKKNLRVWIADTERFRTSTGERAFITKNIVYKEVLNSAFADDEPLEATSHLSDEPVASMANDFPISDPPDFHDDSVSSDENMEEADANESALDLDLDTDMNVLAPFTDIQAIAGGSNAGTVPAASASQAFQPLGDTSHASDEPINAPLSVSPDENMEEADANESALDFTDMNALPPFTAMQTIAGGSDIGTVRAASATLAFHPQGLLNWSNNCYANSILQCLRALCVICHIHIQPSIFTPALYTVQHQEAGSSNFIIQLGRLLLQQVGSTEAMYNAGTHSAHASYQEGLAVAWAEYQNVHQDAMDFLRILQKMTETTIEQGHFVAESPDLTAAWSQVKQQFYDPLFKAMQGEYTNCCQCTECHTRQSRPHSIDTGITLYAPAQSTISLTELLRRDKQQTMNEIKPLHCATCQQQSNHTVTPFSTWNSSVPSILNIQLQRHAVQISDNGFNTSIVGATKITYPDLLTMDGYFNTPARYELVAVIAKIGEYSHAGHYVGYIRDGTSFIRCDDRIIQENTIPPADEAYILMYRLLPTSTRSHP